MSSSDLSNTPAIKSTRFFMRFVGFWLWTDRRGKIIMDLAMYYTIAALTVAWVITASDLWFSRSNFFQAAYAACNAMTVLIILFKLIVFSLQRSAFLDLITFCHINFWQCDYDSFGDKVLRQCEKQCVYFVGTVMFFAQCTVCSYTISPIVVQLKLYARDIHFRKFARVSSIERAMEVLCPGGTALIITETSAPENIGKNETDRVLPFNIWLNLPMTSTPYYEIMFFIETMSLYHSGICFFCFDNFLYIMNVHATGQFRILQRRFELVYYVNEIDEGPESCRKSSLNGDDDDFQTRKLADIRCQYREFKECVRKHQSLINFTKMIESIYTFVILGQVIVSSLLICLITYQAVLADGSTITRRMIFIVHSGGTFAQLFMFTLTCDNLTKAGEEVADAAYRAQWYSDLSNRTSRRLGKDLMIVIMRARRPCSLTAGGFFPVSLETFMTILSTSVSYLTLLRQGQENLR